ncbi:MAG TPA: DUF2339 domain-containing protein [Bryobacteraceae bacterium]|nr:DUF2339 domain-containing protein [Bryobacteraceae bacterium]
MKVDERAPAAEPAPPPLVIPPPLPPPLPSTAVKPDSEPVAPPPLPQPQLAVPTFRVPAFAAVDTPPPMPSVSASAHPPRKSMGASEWEALVGGNWLNKVGVLVFVIGVALLLGYEFTRVGPVGRVAIGLAVSLTMLVGGMALERRPGYAIFARGLMGGGWAALYFTTYAMYGVEAAKVIQSPYLGSTLLLAVAAGMILHSLRYQSQTASGLAYFIAFATLGLSESTPFSVLALLPLAGSLLFLAHRFHWYKMAVFGLLATYATCASRPDTGASLSSTQALFAAYWLLFETFDLLSLIRRAAGWLVESWIFPLNALGFLGLSLVKWQKSAPERLYLFLAAAAALYLASAILRSRLRPPSSFAEDSDTPARIAGGGYEGPITLASALAAAAILRRATGEWINLGLLIEGEVLFVAGFLCRQIYLRQLAGAAFLGSVAKLLIVDKPTGDTITLIGHKWQAWVPVAVLEAAVFYGNRIVRVMEGSAYSSAAAALITLVLGYETPLEYLSVAWMVFAALLFEFGFVKKKPEFLYQSYLIGALGTGAALVVNTAGGDPTWHWPWLPLAICAAIHYAITLHVGPGPAQQLDESERKPLQWVTSASAATFLAAIAWKLAPGAYLGVVWLLIGALLFELGLRKLPEHFRQLSYVVSGVGLANIAWLHVIQAHKGSILAEPISLGLGVLLCYGLSARVFGPIPERIGEPEREGCRDLYAAAGTLLALTLAWLELPAPVVGLAWAVVGLLLLEVGFVFSFGRFRLLGNVVAASVFGRLFLANFTDLGDTLHISHRMLTVVPVVLSQYYTWARYRQAQADGWERNLVRLYLYAPAILAVALARFELGRTLAVVGWALFGLGVYRVGLVRNLADLRWQSYAIAILSFWRSWNTNFDSLASLGGIRSRVLTGAIVIAAFYCAQLLSPRQSARDGVGRRSLDQYSHALYSMLAAVLLAVLLYYEVSGEMLTMAWGVEALALLGAGFPLRDRLQRLSGLSLFLICVLKLFLYDLRQLETINRILSFIVLGALLVGVSWMYTRFRDRLQQYL